MKEAILMLLMAFGWAALFNKKGEEWWKALIPIYSDYVKFKLYWDVKYFITSIILMVTGFIVYFIAIAMFQSKNIIIVFSAAILFVVVFIMALICMYIRIVFLQKVTTAHKKSLLFLVALFLCEPIFICALAYDKTIKKFLDKVK